MIKLGLAAVAMGAVGVIGLGACGDDAQSTDPLTSTSPVSSPPPEASQYSVMLLNRSNSNANLCVYATSGQTATSANNYYLRPQTEAQSAAENPTYVAQVADGRLCVPGPIPPSVGSPALVEFSQGMGNRMLVTLQLDGSFSVQPMQ